MSSTITSGNSIQPRKLYSPFEGKKTNYFRNNNNGELFSKDKIKNLITRMRADIQSCLKKIDSSKGRALCISASNTLPELSSNDKMLFTEIDDFVTGMLDDLHSVIFGDTSASDTEKKAEYQKQLQKLAIVTEQILQMAIRKSDAYQNNKIDLLALAEINQLKDTLTLKSLNPTQNSQLSREYIKGGLKKTIQIINNNQNWQHNKANSKFTLIKPAPMFQTKVISGGGAKASALLVQLRLEEMFGRLQGLKTLSGCSAGAITASLMSCMTISEMQAFNKDYPMNKLLDTSANFEKLYGKNLISKKSHFVVKALKILFPKKVGLQAGNLISHLDKATSNAVSDFLNDQKRVHFVDNKITFEGVTTELTDSEASRLTQLKSNNYLSDYFDDVERYNPNGDGQSQTTKMITFSDLALLHKIAPEKFKKFETNGVAYAKTEKKGLFGTTSKVEKQLVNFNAEETPDMPIAIATRISAALPIAIQPINFRGKTYIDGGIMNCLPYDNFVDIRKEYTVGIRENSSEAQIELEKQQERIYRETNEEDKHAKTNSTLFYDKYDDTRLRFENRQDAKTQAALKGKQSIKARFISYIASRIMKAIFQDTTYEKNLEQMGPNSITSWHGDIGVASFSASEKLQVLTRIDNIDHTLDQLQSRQNEAVYYSFDSLSDLLDKVTDDELMAFLDNVEQDNVENHDKALGTSNFNNLLEALDIDELNKLLTRVNKSEFNPDFAKQIQEKLDQKPKATVEEFFYEV